MRELARIDWIYLRYFRLSLCLTICCLRVSAQPPDSKTAVTIEKQKVIDKIVSKLFNVSYIQRHELYKKGRIKRYIKVEGNPIPIEKELESTTKKEKEILIYKDSIGNIVYSEEEYSFANTKWGIREKHYFTSSGNVLVYALEGIQTLGGDNFDEAWLTNYYDGSRTLIHSARKCSGQSMSCSGFDDLPLTPSLTLKEFLTKKRINP